MNNIIKSITAYTAYKLIEEASKKEKNPLKLLESYGKECELLGGNTDLFNQICIRELNACRLLEQEGGIPAPAVVNSVGGGGVTGLKPDDIGVPVEAQKKYASKNSIFKRRKPNKYYNDESANY